MDKRSLSWEDCLRIASEVADALTYLHKATPRPIIHRDIKPSSILLDEHFSAKVAELGLAVSIPLGETRLELEKIEGTYGSGELLLDLLTGKKAYDWKRTGDRGAAFSDLVISSMKEEWLGLDSEASIESDKKMEQLIAWVELALSCVKPKGEERPTMKEVAQELRRIKGAKTYL
ncbi:wall-associated receptor kinase-like 1 [Magnolia sinica]|uniref:wall-associated receptor kinase-like 1 n=1 Tax=Magnolia sinica TaxID=86752 RepID=UPI002657D86B|nr:wall-associated receptor kinase-like 1 [Magnolia sinica]